jgi:hypothetical protein
MTNFLKQIAPAVLSLLLVGCVPPCKIILLKEKVSPDSSGIAAVYTSDCGATSSVSTIVNIRAGAHKFSDRSDAGNIFVATHAKDINVNWTTGDAITVTVRGDPSIYLQTVKLGSMVITYVFVNE